MSGEEDKGKPPNKIKLHLQPDATVTVKILNAALDKRFKQQLDKMTKLFSEQIENALKEVKEKVEVNIVNIEKNKTDIQTNESHEHKPNRDQIISRTCDICRKYTSRRHCRCKTCQRCML